MARTLPMNPSCPTDRINRFCPPPPHYSARNSQSSIDSHQLWLIQKFQRRLLAFAVDQLADAMELTMIAFLAGDKMPWGLSKGDMALLQTLVLIGMGIGSNATGWVSDRFGRKPATALSIVAAALGGVAAVFSPTRVPYCVPYNCRMWRGCCPCRTLYTDFLPVPDAGAGTTATKTENTW